MYWEQKRRYESVEAGNGWRQEWRQALPAWCSINLHKLLCGIMEEEHDSTFSGEFAAQRWKDEVAALDAEFQT